jgi:hypothetical protein
LNYYRSALIFILALASSLPAFATKSLKIDIPKTQPLIVEIPPAHWAQKETAYGSGIPISVVHVDVSSSNTRTWEDGTLPMLTEFHLEKAHDCGGTGLSAHIVGCPAHWSEVELRSDRAWLKLQFPPETADLTAALKAVVFAGTKEQFIESAYLHDTLFAPNEKRLFAEAPALPVEDRFKIFQQGLRLGSDVASEAFKNRRYITISVPLLTTFNTIRTSGDQRVSEVLRETVLPQAKLFAALLHGDSADGLAFSIVIPAYNFVTGGENKTDILRVYLPLAEMKRFMDSDITSQKLLESSVVLLNGDRVEAKL